MSQNKAVETAQPEMVSIWRIKMPFNNKVPHPARPAVSVCVRHLSQPIRDSVDDNHHEAVARAARNKSPADYAA